MLRPWLHIALNPRTPQTYLQRDKHSSICEELRRTLDVAYILGAVTRVSGWDD